MKKLMNLVKDGVLVTIITSSLAGTPRVDKDSKFLYGDIFSADAFKPKISLFIDKANSRAMSYSNLKSVLDKAYSEIKTPDYITTAVQMARSYVESTDDPNATSPVGARGLLQIMESSWHDVMKGHDFNSAYDPYLNNIASLKHINHVDIYLRHNYPGFDELPNEHKLELLNAAYNGGQGKLKSLDWNIDAMSKQTRDYVQKMRERTVVENVRIRQMHNNSFANNNINNAYFGESNR